MQKHVNTTKFFGGGVLLTADFHPPACRQANEKPNNKQEGE